MPLRHSITFSVCCFGFIGCSINPIGETGHFYYKQQVLEEDFCSGIYEFKSSIKNGYSTIRNSERRIHHEKIEGIEGHFVAQSESKNCWAASTSTIFRYLGYDHTQQQFLEAFKSHCPISSRNGATANQIMFAISETVNPKNGSWLGQFAEFGLDIDWCDTFNLLSFLPSVSNSSCQISSNRHREAEEFFVVRANMQQNLKSSKTLELPPKYNRKTDAKRHIQFIENLNGLISAIDRGDPVMVALNNEGVGHTVIISKIVFRPWTYSVKNKTYTVNENTYVEYVEYLDPQLNSEPERMKGTEFLSKIEFAIYFES